MSTSSAGLPCFFAKVAVSLLQSRCWSFHLFKARASRAAPYASSASGMNVESSLAAVSWNWIISTSAAFALSASTYDSSVVRSPAEKASTGKTSDGVRALEEAGVSGFPSSPYLQ